MNKSRLSIYVIIVGVLLVIIDTIIYGEYTGVPHTIFGFVGCFLMFVMMIIMIYKS